MEEQPQIEIFAITILLSPSYLYLVLHAHALPVGLGHDTNVISCNVDTMETSAQRP